jgi:hypothetical protein
MGELREVLGNRRVYLEAEHLVGRSPQCSLQLNRSYVSAQHALIRWREGSWELLDRGSRNGTRLDGAALEAGRPYPLNVGARITLGHDDEQWELSDSAEPAIFVAAEDGSVQLLDAGGVIGVPSNEEPGCTLYRDVDGLWKLELPDQPLETLRHGQSFEVAGRVWRFCSPEPVGSTETSEMGHPPSAPKLHFAVSRDEEFVELTLERSESRTALGSRSHNYLLLMLARARLADRAANIPESSCGWTYKEQLADGLSMTLQQVDGEVFRIRKHFASHGVEEAGAIIERRARTRQLRIGIRDIEITRS